MSTCTYDLIKENSNNYCDYVRNNCESEYINFLVLHYCILDSSYYFTIPILAFFIFLCFYLISDTSNRYLSPALTILSDRLKMSQNLAGITFLALGNGAPDVISSIVASDDEGGIEFGVGALIGAGMFVTCIVFSTVILYAGSVRVNKNLFIRDIVLYLISIFILMVFAFIGEIGLWQSVGFFSLYIFNVLFAVWQDIKEKKEKKKRKDRNAPFNSLLNSNYAEIKKENKSDQFEINFIPNNEDGNNQHSTGYTENGEKSIELKMDNYHSEPEPVVKGRNLNKDSDNESVNGDSSFEKIAKKITKKVKNFENNSDTEKNKNDKEKALLDGGKNAPKGKEIVIEISNFGKEMQRRPSIADSLKEDHFYAEENFENGMNTSETFPKPRLRRSTTDSIRDIIICEYNSIKYRLKRNYFKLEQKSYKEKNVVGKIMFILIDLPFTFLRDITIPNVEPERWNRIFFIITPFTSLGFVISITKSFYLVSINVYVTCSVLAGLLLISIIFCKFTYRNRPPKLVSLMCIFSFIMSIFWIWFLANNLIDVLDGVGVLFNVPTAFLGLTLLSLGNSLPDLTLNSALAKAGYGEMGIAGSIAGPLFNLLIGLGASLIKKTLFKGPVTFQLFEFSHISVLIGISLLTLNLISLLIQGYLTNFEFKKSVSIAGYILYILFFIGICLFTFIFNENFFK